MTLLLTAIQTTCKFISTNVRRAGLLNLCVPPLLVLHIVGARNRPADSRSSRARRIGQAGSSNVQGEDQKKLDILSNDIMINSLRASGKCAVLVSEENEEPIFIDTAHRGRYCVVFDPLDGSSNIDAGVNIGTIFGVYKCVRLSFPSFRRSASDVR